MNFFNWLLRRKKKPKQFVTPLTHRVVKMEPRKTEKKAAGESGTKGGERSNYIQQ